MTSPSPPSTPTAGGFLLRAPSGPGIRHPAMTYLNVVNASLGGWVHWIVGEHDFFSYAFQKVSHDCSKNSLWKSEETNTHTHKMILKIQST